MEFDNCDQLTADPLSFARSYQLEGLEKALKQNTIVFLETGSGKTLIAIMLLRSYAYLLRKPSPYIAVFLVPKVVLVLQQAKAVETHTDLKVGKYWGDMGVDFWDAATWKSKIDKDEVLVMTPAILLNGLRHSFFRLSMIKVLIMDECHHASGQHPYASILTEFYHAQLKHGEVALPRLFGMTASPIKSKGGNSESTYWNNIEKLENLMNSKVYTCLSGSVLAKYIPVSTTKILFYKNQEISYPKQLINELEDLNVKHERLVENLGLDESSTESNKKKISKIFSTFKYCMDELGVWLAWKAAESLSCKCDTYDFFSWGKLDIFGERIVNAFCSDAYRAFAYYIPSDPNWSISDDLNANEAEGLLSSKVVCLIESLLGYRDLKDMRCIVFVERVITAIVVQSLLSQILSKHCSWETKYIAGNNSGLQSQTRKKQNEIVEEFRQGMVNIVVATSILEEGLDVQSCNLVVRFDPSSNVCSFIQSRGRARMKNSNYLLMVKSGDHALYRRLEGYLSSEDVMRKESLSHASVPCAPIDNDFYEEDYYRVESTGALATLSSSISLIYFYCSRLPSDRYFKPAPKWDEDASTLHLPNSCPIQSITVSGNTKILKNLACLEACKRLHKIGALTDYLVPDMLAEEITRHKLLNKPNNDEHPSYVPPELVNCDSNISSSSSTTTTMYHCYMIGLHQNFDHEISVHNLVLLTKAELGTQIGNMGFDLDVDRGSLSVKFTYVGVICLNTKQVGICRSFQATLFRILMDHKWNTTENGFSSSNEFEMDFIILPTLKQRNIDWETVVVSSQKSFMKHTNCSGRIGRVQTKNGLICTCRLHNSLVYTPHNGHAYSITGSIEELNGNSSLGLRDGQMMTYKKYFKSRHDIELCFERQSLLKGRKIFTVQNYLQRCRQRKEKESTNAFVELPPELISIVMSPISINTLYSFSLVPSIMHRIESLLVAVNFKRLHLDHCMQNDIPTFKVLEAITTKKCQEKFHLESLEMLGDSFLKYATCQQLFRTYPNDHEGLLSVKKDKIVSNASLSVLGQDCKIPGFIRNEPFDPKKWIVPGYNSKTHALTEYSLFDTRKIYIKEYRKLKFKVVADVVEALIGAYLSTGGEIAALNFMSWIGIKVDFNITPYERSLNLQADKFVNVAYLESLLKYTFREPSLLVEALTHGSFMRPEIPKCYQRLEFLGDSVLDYLITVHLYGKYPGLSPGFLTDMRSAMVNNDCYARSAVHANLHKHILYCSHQLHKHIAITLDEFEKLPSESTFGWESESSYPKVLGDVIESLAGAILVDSGYNKDIVFRSIRPLLEPLITPETLRLHPARELTELCQKHGFIMGKPVKSRDNGECLVTIEVEATGTKFTHSATSKDKKTAKKLACKKVLISLNESFFAR